jgi:hypothetical protein
VGLFDFFRVDSAVVDANRAVVDAICVARVVVEEASQVARVVVHASQLVLAVVDVIWTLVDAIRVIRAILVVDASRANAIIIAQLFKC